jgi:hypothetical protein
MEASDQLHALATLHLRKETCYALGWRLGGPRAGLDIVVKRKILLY